MVKTRSVKRFGLLIGNAISGGSFLPGVSTDIANIYEFLRSPAGGYWYKSELIVMQNCLYRQELIQILEEAVSKDFEYFFIYFGGHGELRRISDPVFVLPGGEEITLNEIKSILVGKRVLMISDSCQGIPAYRHQGELNESQRIFSTSNLIQYFKSRQEFDRAILNMPPMFTYASAVSPGESAYDTDTGGLYTQNLLNACNTLLASNVQQDVIGICEPHSIAELAVRTLTTNRQKPCIYGCTESAQPPFLVKL